MSKTGSCDGCEHEVSITMGNRATDVNLLSLDSEHARGVAAVLPVDITSPDARRSGDARRFSP
ncbi:MAG: hypothetical protein ACYDAY_11715 [Candidatus Dormibacteria bacterium]